jgi:hypothetical protein
MGLSLMNMLGLSSSEMAAAPRYIASALTAQKTPLPKVIFLLRM